MSEVIAISNDCLVGRHYYSFKLLITAAGMMFFSTTSSAQKAWDYMPPVKIPIYLSGNVGELRGNHFHSGIDIKTQGVTGKPVYSVASGYVSRVAVSPWGYGLALYITHLNQTTSVYAHLDKFTPQIEQYVREQQYRLKSYAVDLYPPQVQFPVAQGEQVAYSGDSGSSSGPHLHFEIRDAASQPLNILSKELMKFKDTIAPRIVNLYYISVDTVSGIPVHTTRFAMPVKGTGSKRYGLGTAGVGTGAGVGVAAGGEAVKIGPNGYFAVEVSERKNRTSNTFGIYSLEMRVDSVPVFGFAVDKVNFSTTRYSQAVAQHPESKGKRNGVYRLVKLPNNPLTIYKDVRNRGLITLPDDAPHGIEITVADDSGNSSILFFKVRKGLEQANPEASGTPVFWDKNFTYTDEGITVVIPAKSLYESILFTSSVKPQGEGMYSAAYTIHDPEVRLQSNITVSIDAASLPEKLRGKALLGSIAAGKKSAAGGVWKNGKVEAKTRNFGTYYVAVDTIAPRIAPAFKEGADLQASGSMSFTIADDFSGIETYSATIDGEWALFEYAPSRNRITHYFQGPKEGKKRSVELVVIDGKGNKKIYNGSFIR